MEHQHTNKYITKQWKNKIKRKNIIKIFQNGKNIRHSTTEVDEELSYTLSYNDHPGAGLGFCIIYTDPQYI